MIEFIAGLFIGIFLTYFIVRKKLKNHIQLNEEVAKQNLELSNEYQNLIKDITALNIEKQNCQNQINILTESQSTYKNLLIDLEKQAQTAADTFYKDKMGLAEEKFANALEKIAQNYHQAEEEYQKQYLKLLDEFSASYQDTTNKQKEEILLAESILFDLQNKVEAAVEANKRAELERNQKDFYKLILSEQDIKEIKHLRSVVPYLRNAETLNKVIWKAYYEKPYTDLIGRVVGSNIKTGIYKITNLKNGMCYVGQAVKLAGEKLFLVAARGCGIPKFLTNN